LNFPTFSSFLIALLLSASAASIEKFKFRWQRAASEHRKDPERSDARCWVFCLKRKEPRGGGSIQV
jgi:hypothetical protein